MADGDKKGWGGWLLKKSFAVAVGFTMGMGVMPVFADVATWFPEAHNTENLRIKALQNVTEPYTGWIPRHMGFTEEPGALTPLVNALIGPELTRLKEEKAAQAALDTQRVSNNFANPPANTQHLPSPTPDTDPLSGNDPLSGSDPLSGANPLAGGDPLLLSSSYTITEEPLAANTLLDTVLETAMSFV